MTPGFLSVERLTYGPWQALERGIQRLLVHLGFDDVRLVGGTGDRGGDVVANLAGRTWVFQCKYRSNGQVWGRAVLDELAMAITAYGAEVGVLACNTAFDHGAVEYATKLGRDLGVRILLWDFNLLLSRYKQLSEMPAQRQEPRDYQRLAIDAVNNKIMAGGHSALVLMATGLGKTRVTAGIIEEWFSTHGRDSEILVLAPSLSLIPQLEASFWPYLSKHTPTHVITGSEKPSFEGGVTVATYQSMIHRADGETGRYDLVVVDEAHHAPADSTNRMLTQLKPRFLLGLTATPWRSDERHLEKLFGDPVFSMGIVEGMMRGFLAQVDYRMFIDDVDWEWVREHAGEEFSVAAINKRLFIPQRDDAIIEQYREAIKAIAHPRTLIFCSSQRHAESFTGLLQANGVPCRFLHSGLDRFEATQILRDFRQNRLDTLVSVDMLNEGIDVPDVNVILFLRVTHSRRVFVQQLGRGLRISPEKEKVTVLDFVSDLKRVTYARTLNKEAGELSRQGSVVIVVPYDHSQIIRFASKEPERLVATFLRDVSDIDDDDERIRLQYPAE